MTADMAPPPPKEPNPSSSGEPSTTESQTLGEPSLPQPARTSMPPPPPKATKPLELDSAESQKDTLQEPQSIPSQDEPEPPKIADGDPTIEKSDQPKQDQQRPSAAVPYTIPEWSGPPSHNYTLEVLKEGSIIDQLNVHEKGAYMFGRVDLCDFMLEHPTVSRFHAVLQFKRSGNAFLYDLGSTHGSFVNKNQVKKRVYVELHVGDVIRFGHSSRLYILQGPSELMRPERDLKSIRNAKKRAELQDMEASLRRAKAEAARADGISWGMGEDAEEEIEEDFDEITWQNFKGQLTERQEKTRDKVLKRLEKIANMKKEIDAIRVKDISQGGLTQGQQTQIARNEQRTAEIMEELENLEETLNESIRESLGARSGKIPHPKKKGAAEDEDDDYLSEEDDFYDRTKPKRSKRINGGDQSVETADTLLDKKDAIVTEMEETKKLLLDEKKRLESENEGPAETGDALDAFMSGLSSQLVVDTTEKLQKELSTLQSELDRVLYLLKIADPTGEASRKRESKSLYPKPNSPELSSAKTTKEIPSKPNKIVKPEKIVNDSVGKERSTDAALVEPVKQEASEVVVVAASEKKEATVYTVAKPQWLGAVQNTETPKEIQSDDVQEEEDDFVDYKDRKEALKVKEEEPGIENAAPGLIIRKRKQAEKTSDSDAATSKQSEFTPIDTEISAVDAVALLLKHQKGYHAADDEVEDMPRKTQIVKDHNTKKLKRAIGPEKPSFLKSDETDYETTWVPPKGQSGDGRTSLNDRYGY